MLDARLRSVVIARQAELLAQADRLREAELAMQARPALKCQLHTVRARPCNAGGRFARGCWPPRYLHSPCCV